ncbi:Protein of unknown function [Rhizobium sp. RU35A]|uniref:DUF2635 domain-containing protein n=1 Tax=Rhizobium sp. RU35A TaxID=1907414 RepID=UPI000956BC60|nr:DUF2635 domain-containing protein [Rhizobium sp. RU35A]SIQ23892.1 Protein of unknown function [Rhizobium sp. RU35A]
MTKFLKPAEGRTIDQETGEPWPIDGMDAPDTLFVRRRLIDGDLIEVAATDPAGPIDDGKQTDTAEPSAPASKPKGGK